MGQKDPIKPHKRISQEERLSRPTLRRLSVLAGPDERVHAAPRYAARM
jgi:hypothetical protein